MKLEEKTIDALRWIVGILDNHSVPYRIGGGFAAKVYGSPREVNDIDFSLPGKYFPIILSDISDFVTYPLGHYVDQKWDCDGLSLEYHGQEIDMADLDTIKVSNKERTGWISVKENYRKFDPVRMDIEGITVSLLDPRDLVAYKKELDGDHQSVDIKAIKQHLSQKGL